MKENISICEEWLLKERIKAHIETPNKTVTIKYSDLLKLFMDFIKLNKRGE